jgi:uncharacterized protein with HEPN domain
MTTRGTELQDDQLVEYMLEVTRRATAYRQGRSFEQFASDPVVQDALAGCLMGLAGAASEISEHLENWLTTVPWDTLRAMATWRIHNRDHARVLWKFVEEVGPPLVAELDRFLNPPTDG